MGYSPSVVVSASDQILGVISKALPCRRMLQFCRVALALGALLIIGMRPAHAGTFTAFGPQDYARNTGDPVTVTSSFSVLNPNTQYTLKAFNGGLQDAATELVSSGFVTVNGVQVLGPNNFNQNVTEVDVPVTLQASNTISVQVRGKPGGVLTIEIVGVDNDLPTIQATVSPAPNAAGWNNTNVTVTFVCGDATSPVASCSGPQTVTTEGAHQVISGTATDAAGNSASTSVTLNIDKTPPLIAITSPANGASLTSSSLSVTGTVTDALSGVAAVTCDGAPASVQSGAFTCSVTLTPGANTLTTQASDVAGNSSSASENLTLSNAPAPVINSFTPTSGPIGTQVVVTGSNFTANGTATPKVALSQQNGGSIGAPVANFTDSTISFVIPAGAASGTVAVTVGGQSASSATSLSVVASSSFSVSAGPTSASVQQGTSTAYSVSLSSSNGFSQLASLSLSGLPSGLTAGFLPNQITAGGTSILTITAPAGQPVGNASLTISAAATVDGIPTTQSTTVALTVQTATTSLIGRTVESDNNETPIPGIVITMLGVDDAGHTTGCSGQTRSDAAGNFAFVNLATSCLGRQLVGYDGNTATDGEKYAGVNLAYTMVAGQITGPELVHMPTISDAETIMVKQNATVDQVFSYSTIPGITVTVYAGTTLTLPDGTVPDPFPMAAVLVPVDRLPDAPSPTTGTLRASIVAFQPANTTSSLPVSVTFPNVVNTPPGVNMELDTLDPIVGELVKYGTGTVSSDATEIVPDADPAHPGHRFGISHFDWHGPMAPAPNGNNPSPDPNAPKNGDPVDTATGLLNFTKTDMAFGSARGQVSIQRTFRTLSGTPGPFGVGTNHNYGYLLDTSNLIRGTGTFVNLVMPDGNQFQFVQQGANTFVNSTIPSLLGAVLTRLSTTAYTLRWKNGSVFRFDTSSQGVLLAFLSSITDLNGNTITLVRGNSSQPTQITQITDPVGRALTLTYDSFNRILSIADPIGRTVQYTYNTQGTLATVTDAGGGITNYGYDPQNRMTSITDARGITFLQNTYDGNSRVIQQKAADGGITTFSYTLLNPSLSTSPVLLTAVTDPMGNITTYHFNPQGFLLDKTDPLGEKTIYALDPESNLPIAVTDPLGRVTTITYDLNGNMVSNTRMSGTASAVTTSFTYNPVFNRLTSSTDGLGNTTTRAYDTAGNLASITDPLGHKWTFQHDANGELTGVSDPLGNAASYAYTNGLITSTTDPQGNTSLQMFDAVGRMMSTTSPLGQTTQFSYTPLNLIQQITDPSGGITRFTYDRNGNKLSMTDAMGHTTNYAYDNMDRLLSRTDALQRQESYAHDLNGNLLSATDRKGQITLLSYDALNRPIFEGFKATNLGANPSFESTISYTYDVVNRVTRAVDSGSGTIADIYDDLDRLVNENTPEGSIAYGYDAAGRETSMQVAGQPAIAYTYDNASRTTQISQAGFGVNFSYDDAGRRTVATMSNGIAVAYAYDSDSRLTGLSYRSSSSVLGDLTYAYNELGQRTRIGGSFARSNLSPSIASASYDAANQQTNWNNLALSYDANGNLLSDGTNIFVWNARNQLASVNGVALQYDAFGRRTKNAAGTSFLYDGANPIQGLSGTTVVANFLTGGIDELFSLTNASGTFTPLRDVLGSTVALVDANGKVQTSYTYDPFGNTSVSGTPNDNSFQFSGRENDGNGLYYLRARYYSPALIRFINEDPLGFAGSGSNLYRYAYGNPISMTDPFGLSGGGGGTGGGGSGLAGRKNDCNCNLDIDAFVQQMDDQAEDSSQGSCAKYVRMGLDVGLGGEASDENDLGSPIDAKNWGQWLVNNQGFTNITDDWNGQPGYGASVGDIAVFQPANGSNASGHVEVWDGTQWVSDFKQGAPVESGKYEGAHFFPNLSKYGRQPYQIYHYNCKCN